MSRCILEGDFTHIVYTASFGGDVKPSVPGYWLVLAFSAISSYLITATRLVVSLIAKKSIFIGSGDGGGGLFFAMTSCKTTT